MSGRPELVNIIEGIARERGIDKEILFESLEVAMEAAARKKYIDAEEVEVSIDRMTGSIRGVRDGKLIDAATLGRIAAQTAKQVMMQKFREAEQDRIFNEFYERKGTMVTGTIQRFEGENIIIDINKADAILPRHERVRTESYNVGDRIRSVIADVRKVGHRVRIVLSRTHPDLVRRLFELEIPEISEHVIEVKGIAREAGFRTKLAVVSYDSKVDCVGACVGIRGSRIRNIIDELNGEKIDIIRWNDSPELLIMNSLKPAEILSITLDDETTEAVVTVAEDQLSLAIGKRGQNVRLAARLTGWDVRIVSPGAEKLSDDGSSKNKTENMSDEERRVLDQLRGEESSPTTTSEAKPKVEAADSDADPLLEMARRTMTPAAGAAGLAGLLGDDNDADTEASPPAEETAPATAEDDVEATPAGDDEADSEANATSDGETGDDAGAPAAVDTEEAPVEAAETEPATIDEAANDDDLETVEVADGEAEAVEAPTTDEELPDEPQAASDTEETNETTDDDSEPEKE